MRTALFFITYHPASLVKYVDLCGLDGQKSHHILILCRHPYLTDEIIQIYSNKFDEAILLPDLEYQTNFVHGIKEARRFLRSLKEKTYKILNQVRSFNIISDCSAYLPINMVLSTLRREKKCCSVISIREDFSLKPEFNILSTVRSAIYTSFFNLNRVYHHKSLNLGYHYCTEPSDKILLLLSPYEKLPNKEKISSRAPVYFASRSPQEKINVIKNIVLFFSDICCKEEFGSLLSDDEFDSKMREFITRLALYYNNQKIVFKAHPLDKRAFPDYLKIIDYEGYDGSFTSDIYLELISSRVKACYSVSSTSLLYAASLGIPSYTLYKYLHFEDDFPKTFFENERVRQNPFIYHIQDLTEIGIIDSLAAPPEPFLDKEWEKALSFET